MRIDYKGEFANLLQRVNVAQTKDAREIPYDKFQTLLRNIVPEAFQAPDSTADSIRGDLAPPTLEIDQKGPMARLSTNRQTFQMPDLIPSEMMGQADKFVNEIPPDVKTPTLLGARRVPTSSHSSPSPETVAAVKEWVDLAGIKHGIDPALGKAVAQKESSFNPAALSQDGHHSKGVFQLLDKTGATMIEKFNLKNEYSPWDPQQNIDLGVGYLRYLHDIFSSPTQLPKGRATIPAANSASLEKLAVAAYNAGEGRVASAQARALKSGDDPSEYEAVEPYLPESTQKYVADVIQKRSLYSSDDDLA